MVIFLLNSVAFGCALSLDSFSICVADALVEPAMSRKKKFSIILLHSLMQAAMPMAGYFCVHFIATLLPIFLKITPYISLVLLSYIGGSMIYESTHSKDSDTPNISTLTTPIILMQGVAASIDALSVGFSIANFNATKLFVCVTIIAMTTFIFCIVAFFIGKCIADKYSSRAKILGGVILILIGIEILISSFR